MDRRSFRLLHTIHSDGTLAFLMNSTVSFFYYFNFEKRFGRCAAILGLNEVNELNSKSASFLCVIYKITFQIQIRAVGAVHMLSHTSGGAEGGFNKT